MNSEQLVLSIPNFPAQWPCTFLGTGRIEGVGDLAGWLIPTEWIWSQKSHFQEPFFSKVICEHRKKKGYIENNVFTQYLLSQVCCLGWRYLRVTQPGLMELSYLLSHGIVLPLSWNWVTGNFTVWCLYKLSKKEYQNLAYRRKKPLPCADLTAWDKKQTVDKGEVWTRTDSFFPHLNISPFAWGLPSPLRLWAETLAIRCWPLKQIRLVGCEQRKLLLN